MGTSELDGILNQTFAFAKRAARKWYFEWAKNPPNCGAFKGEVIHITREGWEHITHEEAKTRTDILGRLFVLERAKELLETATSFQSHTERTDVGHRVEYWIFEAEIEIVRIRVVVRSIKDGPKHFLSVIKRGSIEKEIK